MYFEKGYALLIGVGNHEDATISNLPATVNDVKLLSQILLDPKKCAYHPDNVHIVTEQNATKKEILSQLDWLVNKAHQNPDSTVLFLFSGHGWLSKEDSYCLICHDTVLDDILGTSISEDIFYKKISLINSKRVVIFLDTCHSAGAIKSQEIPTSGYKIIAPPVQRISEKLSVGYGKVIIASCDEDEKSFIQAPEYKFSVFTLALVGALAGKAKSYNEFVGVIDVYTYLYDSVPLIAAKQLDLSTGQPAQQHPLMQGIKTNNFPIALKQRSPISTEQVNRLNIYRKELQAPLEIYYEQKKALELDIALSSIDLQRQSVLRRKLQLIESDIQILEIKIKNIDSQLNQED